MSDLVSAFKLPREPDPWPIPYALPGAGLCFCYAMPGPGVQDFALGQAPPACFVLCSVLRRRVIWRL